MICHSVPQMPYRQFSKKLHERACNSRIPLSGSLELTYRCNCNCLHCYCNLPADEKSALAGELSTRDLFGTIDQIAENGCLWLLITGGECLLRSDFADIWAYAKQKGLLLTLFTNGTLVDRKTAEFIKKWPAFSIEISLYGSTSKTHEKITRKPGSFEKCMQGVENLLSCGLPLRLKTMVLRENVHELMEMKEVARRLGVDFRFDALVNARLDSKKNPCISRLSPSEVVGLDIKDEKRWGAWTNFFDRLDTEQSHDLFSCGAGVTSFAINPEGKLQPCGLITKPNWDMRRVSFLEGWQEMPLMRRQKPSPSFPCGECESYSMCGQCPGWAMTEHQKFDVPVDYLCQVTGELVKALRENRETKP